MRKLVIAVCSLIMSLVIILSGCSCTNTSPLSFNTNFAGGGANAADLSGTYKEVCTYDVSYNPSYNASLKIEDSIKDKVSLDYKGTYVTEFKGDLVSLPPQIVTDITFDGDIHYLTTKLELDVTVNGQTYHDSIFNEVYFYSAGQSFAPVYSKTIQKNTFISITNSETSTEVNADQNLYQYEIRYGKEELICSQKVYAEKDVKDVDIYNFDQTKLQSIKDDTVTEYTLKQAIDNSQLLFAIRNVTVQPEGSYVLPTVSPSYGEPKQLSITNASESTVTVPSITFNGVEYKDVSMPVKNMAFVISGTSNIGTQQSVIIQKSASDGFPHYNSLLLEYAESLSEIGTFNHLGALVYKLSSVEITA